MGLASMFGWNGVNDFIAPRRNALLGASAGFLSGNLGNVPLYAMEGKKQDDAFATAEKAKAERAQQIQQAAAAARSSGAEDLAKLLESGIGVSEATGLYGAMNKLQDNATPANVREWQYFNSLSPDDQSAYLRMKRANPYLDIGTGFVQPDPINPGTTAGPPIVKEVRQEAAERAGGAVEGRVEAERAVEAPMANAQRQQLDSRTDLVMSTIDKALGQTNWLTTGVPGAVTGGVPGLPSYDLRKTIDTIKANIGFAELQAMRDASPTGGALGQVAVQELDMLQSVLASLDPNQSQEQLAANLATIKQLLERQKQYRLAAQEAKFGDGNAWTVVGVE